MPNLYEPEWDTRPELPRKGARLGHAAGARELGVTLYELPAGGAVSPYHLHYPEVAEYPGMGTTLTVTEPGAGKAFSGEMPYAEMLAEAMRRDAEVDQRGTSTS
jgi:hypothetical protein